jgi:hypothetical protein
MATAAAIPNSYQVMRPSVLGIGLATLASLTVACGGNEGATGGATEPDADNAYASECADAKLGANMSAEEYRLARIEYRRAEPAYSPVSPAQLAEAEFALHRTFIEVTPPGAQAEFAYEVCSDLASLGILESPELVTAALGFGYNDCVIERHSSDEANLGNMKKVQDTYRRIYIKARTILCPRADESNAPALLHPISGLPFAHVGLGVRRLA